MARSPFQGTYQDGVRPTVVTAPDAIVYINGESDVLGCDNCRRRFDINRYITDVSVDLNVDNAPGSASFSLTVPRHTIDDFMVEGSPLITPMMEVEIYIKGNYLIEGVPQYYPAFWGLVTEVTDNYSAGAGGHTVSVSCSDILKWWELCKMNVNPAFTQASGTLGRNYIYGNLFQANVYDVIWTLAQQSFGDIVQATGSLVSSFREQNSSNASMLQNVMGGIIQYWADRFKQIRSNLLLYGVTGAAVRGDQIYDATRTKTGGVDQKWASKAIRTANGGEGSSQVFFDPENVVPFRQNLSSSAQPNFWQSEYQSKLELANACKEAVGFEFYMDVTGDIVFKPPFYNLDILSNKPVSWVQDIDIIDWSFSLSGDEVVNDLTMQGSFEGGPMDMGVTSDYNTPFTQVIDYHLLRKFGHKPETYNAEYLQNTEALFYMGLDLMDRKNARRHRGTVKIPVRPELRLGFPIYIAAKDQIWYIQGINHNIAFGGQATTTLTLTAKREKFIAPRGIGSLHLTGFKNADKKAPVSPLVEGAKPTNAQLSKSGAFKLKIGEAASIPSNPVNPANPDSNPYAPLNLTHSKTGRRVGFPNAVLTYTQPFNPTTEDLARLLGQKSATDKRVAKKLIQKENPTARGTNLELQKAATTQTAEKDLADRHLSNRYFFGMTSAGVYTYTRDMDQVIQELVLLPAKNLDVSIAGVDGAGLDLSRLLGKTATIRPISDERGFELIGHYRYGRGVALRDGSLVLSNAGKNDRARIDTQVALSGGLYEALVSQQQGLTTLTSTYANPVAALSNLQPDDLQTAGVISPDTGAPVFVNQQTNFVDTAPLNSPEQKGIPTSTEASLLSRALTLGELSPFHDSRTTNADCSCITSRSDLAFLNIGYQVKVLNGSAGTDSTNLSTAPGGTGNFGEGQRSAAATAAIQADIQRLNESISTLEQDPILETTPSLQTQLANYKAQLADAQKQLASGSLSISQVDEAGPILDENGSAARPVMGGGVVRSQTETISAVESFLANLYQALDAPHQEYERALRGNLIPGPSREQILEGTYKEDQFGKFKPPFSPMGRALGGDVAALGKQGETAVDNMGLAWKRFGENLQDKPERAELQTQVAQLDLRIQNLNKEEARLIRAQEAGNTIINPGGSIDDRLKQIASDRSEAIRQRDDAQAKIQDINNRVTGTT